MYFCARYSFQIFLINYFDEFEAAFLPREKRFTIKRLETNGFLLTSVLRDIIIFCVYARGIQRAMKDFVPFRKGVQHEENLSAKEETET